MTQMTQITQNQVEYEKASDKLRMLLLLREIQRLNSIIEQKERQMDEVYLRIAQYQSQEQRYNETLCLLVLLFAEVQSLRMRLDQSQKLNKKQHTFFIQNQKVTKLIQDKPNDSVDFSILRQLEQRHRNLTFSLKNNNNKRQYGNTDNTQLLKPSDTDSHPSVSITSSKSLSSNQNLEHSFSLQYYKQIALQNLTFLPKSPTQSQLYQPLKTRKNHIFNLVSFGRISESKNIQSSESSALSHKQMSLGGVEGSEMVNEVQNTGSKTSKNLSFLGQRRKIPLALSINLENPDSSRIG